MQERILPVAHCKIIGQLNDIDAIREDALKGKKEEKDGYHTHK